MLPFMRCPVAGLSKLETALLRPDTRRQYLSRLREFVKRCEHTRMNWDSHQKLDLTLIEFFDLKFAEGAPIDDANKLIAALQYMDTTLAKRAQTELPRACRAMRAWAKYGPGRQRLPLPFMMLAGMVGCLLRRGKVAESLCLVLQHHTHLRP